MLAALLSRASSPAAGEVDDNALDELHPNGVTSPASPTDTPTDISGLSALASSAPITAKPGAGADTPSPKALEAFALAEADIEEEEEPQSAHDRDLVNMVLSR